MDRTKGKAAQETRPLHPPAVTGREGIFTACQGQHTNSGRCPVALSTAYRLLPLFAGTPHPARLGQKDTNATMSSVSSKPHLAQPLWVSGVEHSAGVPRRAHLSLHQYPCLQPLSGHG